MASVKSGLDSRKGSSSEIRNMRTQLRIWRSVTIAISILVLILIISDLHSVCKQVKFLQSIQSDWLPKQTNASSTSATGRPMSNQVVQLENFRQDLHVLVIELWSARTTLILGLIFVVSYILSWAWITYQLESGVSLKNVLLLVVFAAVDIAASTGFIMVRVITNVISSSDFPRDMRVVRDQEQMAALASLRLSVLQSSSGSTDIFISALIAFLTAVRVYIVVFAVMFYNRSRKDPAIHHSTYGLAPQKYRSGDESDLQSVKIIDDLLKPQGNYMAWNKVTEGNKETLHKEISNSTRKFSISTESVTGGEEDSPSAAAISAEDFKIQAADMPIHMQRAALNGAIQACRLYTTEKHIAESIKQDFDQMFGATWHCIVGRNWGSCVTHSKQCYIRILYKDFTILLYRST